MHQYKNTPQKNEFKNILSFTEKPNLTIAQAYLDSGNYYWNSGIFIFKASVYLNELKNLNDFTLFGLVKWMKSQLQEFLPALDRIDLYESDGNGVELFIHKE